MRRSPALLLPLLAAFAAARPAGAATLVQGANVHLSNGPELDSARAMHVNVVRIDVVWSLIEIANGVYDWHDLDLTVQAARSRGLAIYATIGSTPKWACRMGVIPVEGSCVPQDGTIGPFVTALATRYRGAIAVYSIWNEPDETVSFQGDPLSYVDSLLVPAATAIRAADPFAKVAAPDLSGSFGAPRSPGAFFDAIARRNAAGLVDIVSQHVYEEGSFTGPNGILNKFYNGDTFHHSLLYWIQRSVLASRDVWITEFGFNGGGDSGGGADILRVFQVFGPRPHVTALFVYELQDCVGCVTPAGGLLRSDGSWKPGAHALASQLTDLDPTPPAFRDRFSGAWSETLFRWLLPSGGGSVSAGRLVNSVGDFRAKVQDLAVTDFEISSTVQITDDLGNAFNWVGLAGRTQAASDGGTESGYLAFLRSNGDVGLYCKRSGLNLSARTGRNPKALPVRLALSATGNRIAVSVDGVEALVAFDSTYGNGTVGLQNHALGAHADVVVKTSPLQSVPAIEPVGIASPPALARRRP